MNKYFIKQNNIYMNIHDMFAKDKIYKEVSSNRNNIVSLGAKLLHNLTGQTRGEFGGYSLKEEIVDGLPTLRAKMNAPGSVWSIWDYIYFKDVKVDTSKHGYDLIFEYPEITDFKDIWLIRFYKYGYLLWPCSPYSWITNNTICIGTVGPNYHWSYQAGRYSNKYHDGKIIPELVRCYIRENPFPGTQQCFFFTKDFKDELVAYTYRLYKKTRDPYYKLAIPYTNGTPYQGYWEGLKYWEYLNWPADLYDGGEARILYTKALVDGLSNKFTYIDKELDMTENLKKDLNYD